jgi:hypothetical protein
MCELTLEAAGIPSEKAEWRRLAEDSRRLAHQSITIAKAMRDSGDSMMALSYLRSALRARQWANDWMKDSR